MQLFRITRASRAGLDGTGGLHASGRWHTRGRRVVYTAACRALAILEVLVHTDPEDVPDGLVLLTLNIPETVSAEEVAEVTLLPGWNSPLSSVCRPIGDAWLASARTALLHVPSAVAPDEWNTLINPAHPDAARIRTARAQPFGFDPRLLDPAHRPR